MDCLMKTAKIKILDRLTDPDVYFIKITVGDRVKFERVDDMFCRQYRTTLTQALEAVALDYADEVGEVVERVVYE